MKGITETTSALGGGIPWLRADFSKYRFPADNATQNVLNQGRVNTGIGIIDKIFGGGSYGTNAASEYKPGTQYYNSKGGAIPNSAIWKYLGPLNAQAGNLFTGHGTSEGFNDDFYNRIKNSYEKFAGPQLMTQYSLNNNALNARLADRGVLGGSNASSVQSSLNREQGLQRQNIANTALGLEQNVRQNVANSRSNVVNQLVQSQDPSLAASQATSAVASLQAPNPLPAVGNLFQNWANTYLAGQLNSTANNNPYVTGAANKGPSVGGVLNNNVGGLVR